MKCPKVHSFIVDQCVACGRDDALERAKAAESIFQDWLRVAYATLEPGSFTHPIIHLVHERDNLKDLNTKLASDLATALFWLAEKETALDHVACLLSPAPPAQNP